MDTYVTVGIYLVEMGMVIPILGERAKKHATITVDPAVWQEFQDIVKTKEPEGDTSASSHIETLIKNEIARINDSNVPDAINVACLRRRLLNLRKTYAEMKKSLEKRDDNAKAKLNELGRIYDLKADLSNASEVIRKMLEDNEEEDTPVREILDELREGDLSLHISMIEISVQENEINKKLLEANKQRYLHHT